MSEAEEAQIRFLFGAGRVCGQPWCSEQSLNKYFTYAQLKSYRLGRERHRKRGRKIEGGYIQVIALKGEYHAPSQQGEVRFS